MKTRIEFASVKEAKTAMKDQGGLYFLSHNTGKCFWYSFGHTFSEVMMDQKGNGFVGTYTQFE